MAGHPEYGAFCVKVGPDTDWDKFNDMMAAHQDAMCNHIEEVAERLGINYSAASSIVYLRGRSRWSQELEDRIIRAAKANPNINCFKTGSGEEEEFLEKLGF